MARVSVFGLQGLENPRVGGSIPSPATILYLYINDLARFSIFRKMGFSFVGNVLATAKVRNWEFYLARRIESPARRMLDEW